MRRLGFCAFALWLVCAAPALGSHRPSHRTVSRLNAAVRHSNLMPPPIRHGRFHLGGARVSTRGPWAKATVVPSGGLKRSLDPVLGIFRRHSRDWRLVSAGTAEVGCDHPRLPGRVRRDLHLSCPRGMAAAARVGGSVRRCRQVQSGGETARQVRAHNGLGCRTARRHLSRWLHHGFPRDETGWYCDMSGRQKLCSFGNGAAPYLTFRLRR